MPFLFFHKFYINIKNFPEKKATAVTKVSVLCIKYQKTDFDESDIRIICGIFTKREVIL